MRRLGRQTVRAFVVLAVLAGALLVAEWSGALRGLERELLVRSLARITGMRVSLRAVGGTLGRTLVLEELRLSSGGRTMAHVARLEIAYAPLALLRGVIELRRVTATGP